MAIGAAPITEAMPRIEADQSTFKLATRRTPTGAKYIGDARRGAKALSAVSFAATLAGIAAEMASLLASISAGDIAKKVDWPRAEGVWQWDKCEFLPNSDAPAVVFGVGIGVLAHTLNIIVLVALATFLVRYWLRPKANYGIAAAGLFLQWLGLSLLSRWVGSVQVACGAVMMFIGSLDLIFGFEELRKAVRKAFGDGDKVKENEEKLKTRISEEQKRRDAEAKSRQTARDVTRLLSAYVPLNPIAGGGGFRGGNGGFM